MSWGNWFRTRALMRLPCVKCTIPLQLHHFGHLRKTGGRGSYRLVHTSPLLGRKPSSVKSNYSGHPTKDVHPEPAEGLFSLSFFPNPSAPNHHSRRRSAQSPMSASRLHSGSCSALSVCSALDSLLRFRLKVHAYPPSACLAPPSPFFPTLAHHPYNSFVLLCFRRGRGRWLGPTSAYKRICPATGHLLQRCIQFPRISASVVLPTITHRIRPCSSGRTPTLASVLLFRPVPIRKRVTVKPILPR